MSIKNRTITSMPKFYGKPALHAQKLYKIASLRAISAWAVAVLVIISINEMGGIKNFTEKGFKSFSITAMLVVAVCAVHLARKEHVNAHKAKAGVDAEYQVAKALKNSSAFAVVNGALLGKGGDADHIVLGPMAVLIETKHGKGEVSIQSSVVFAGRKKIPKDPISQVNRQSAALSKRINGKYVQAILCVTQMSNSPFRYNGVIICSSKDLAKVVNDSQNHGITKLEAENFAKIIHTQPVPYKKISSKKV